MDTQIIIHATYRTTPEKAAETEAIIAGLRTTAANQAFEVSDIARGADQSEIAVVYTFAHHDALDAALSQVAPALEDLTSVAPLAALHVSGPLRSEAMDSFRKLDATFADPKG